MTDMIPASMLPYFETFTRALGGVLLMILGLSYGYKFFQASFLGKVNYWSGLEKRGYIVGMDLFLPLTLFFTPLIVHTPPTDKNLIKTRSAGWVHLFWGPIFFLLSLMMLVTGADYLHLPGTQVMNFVLTCGNPNVPPAITYQPPFTYKFPILKKARRTIAKLLTNDIYLDKNKQVNPFDDSKKIKLWEEDEDDLKADEEDRLKALQQSQPAPAPQPAPKKK